MLKFDTVILGGGLSGLLCGILLSKKGQKVCILEKNPEIGGAVQSFRRSDVTLDTGMNFFGAGKNGQIQDELFKIFGLKDHLNISERKESVFKVLLRGTEYCLPTGFDNYEKKLICYFPTEKEAIKKYLLKIKEIYFGLNIDNIYKQDIDNEAYRTGACNYIAGLTDNKDLQDLLVFNNMLYGSERDAVSLYLHSVITASYIDSFYEFSYGIKGLTDYIKTYLQNSESKLLTSKKVVSINSKNDSIVSCTTEDGLEIYSENFISSLHPATTFSLIKSPVLKKFYRNRVNNLDNSVSAFLIYFIMKDSVFEFQNEISFILNDDNAWNYFPGTKNFMMYTPVSAKNKKNSNVIKVMRLMDFKEVDKWENLKLRKTNPEYKEFKRNIVEDIIKTISNFHPDFKKKIKKYYTSTPLTFIDFTGTPSGSAYGIIHDFKSFPKSSLSVRTKFKNLFLTGQNIYFHGMLGVSITSLITCSYVLKKKIYD